MRARSSALSVLTIPACSGNGRASDKIRTKAIRRRNMQGSFEKSLASEVLKFWFGEGAEYGKAHQRWFEKDPSFDAEVSRRFSHVHDAQLQRREWLATPHECLARIIVLDQFPRQDRKSV